MKRNILVIAAVAACVAASADMTFVGTVAGVNTKITHDSGSGDVESHVFAGKLQFNATGEGLGVINTLCVDLDNSIGGGDTYDVTLINTLGLGTNMELAGNVLRTWWDDAGTDDTKASALQLAVWEAVYDGGAIWDGATGDFFVREAPAAVLTQAAIYYNGGVNNSANAIWLNPVTSGQGQMTPVPEPTTMAALGLGAAAIGLRIRSARRRKLVR